MMVPFLQRVPRPPESVPFDRHDIEAAGGFDYLALASRCATQNSFNRLHIELENVCTPLELAALGELARRRGFPKPGRAWIEKLRQWKPDLFHTPRAYQRRVFGRQIYLYHDPRLAPPGRGLLIAFTGNARRLMLPISVFLQYVDPAAWDVLVLTKRAGGSYWEGLAEIAEDFRGFVRHVEANLNAADYRRRLTLGTSSGGLPAIAAALFMRAERGISVSGLLPNPLPAGIFDDKTDAGGTDLRFLYGSDFPRDHHAAVALQKLRGGTLTAVKGVNTHNVLGTLMKRGELVALLDQLLA